jgi:AraC family transcriptional regulator
MALASRLLASGSGWRVADVVCNCGPHDRPFEEQHGDVCIAAVTGGAFRYKSSRGAAVLSPGALLLGNHRDAFECSHEHGVGDRCLAFHFTPPFLQDVIAAVPGARSTTFTIARLPPLPALLPIVAAAESAREDGDGAAFEELSLQLAGAVAAALVDSTPWCARTPTRRDETRIGAAVRLIERAAHEPLSLAELAGAAAMSAYHFLRTFRAVVGLTPHQYILHTRLHRAAVRLRCTDESISHVAYAAGFNDLSTFDRRFARVMGTSPSAYRRAHR